MIKFSYIVDAVTGLLAFGVCVLLAGVANEMFIKSPDGFDLVLIFSFSLLGRHRQHHLRGPFQGVRQVQDHSFREDGEISFQAGFRAGGPCTWVTE